MFLWIILSAEQIEKKSTDSHIIPISRIEWSIWPAGRWGNMGDIDDMIYGDAVTVPSER